MVMVLSIIGNSEVISISAGAIRMVSAPDPAGQSPRAALALAARMASASVQPGVELVVTVITAAVAGKASNPQVMDRVKARIQVEILLTMHACGFQSCRTPWTKRQPRSSELLEQL